MPPLSPQVCTAVVCIHFTMCISVLIYEIIRKHYALKNKRTRSKYGYFENIVGSFKTDGDRAYCDVYVRANAEAGIDKLIVHVCMQTRYHLKWVDDVSKIFIFEDYHTSAGMICRITEADKCRMCIIAEACSGNVELERKIRYFYDKD